MSSGSQVIKSVGIRASCVSFKISTQYPSYFIGLYINGSDSIIESVNAIGPFINSTPVTPITIPQGNSIFITNTTVSTTIQPTSQARHTTDIIYILITIIVLIILAVLLMRRYRRKSQAE